MTLVLFNKPYGVVCQFSAHEEHPSLAQYLPFPDIYPAGRLDTDSEGLMLLTDDGRLQHAIAHPGRKQEKAYLVQVEGQAQPEQLERLRAGLDLGDFHTLPCKAFRVEPPAWLWPRTPPVRFRATLPTDWLVVKLTEGKNRQVRRMTAAVGLPTLRLVRIAVGPWSLESTPLLPGEWREVDPTLMSGIDLPSLRSGVRKSASGRTRAR